MEVRVIEVPLPEAMVKVDSHGVREQCNGSYVVCNSIVVCCPMRKDNETGELMFMPGLDPTTQMQAILEEYYVPLREIETKVWFVAEQYNNYNLQIISAAFESNEKAHEYREHLSSLNKDSKFCVISSNVHKLRTGIDLSYKGGSE